MSRAEKLMLWLEPGARLAVVAIAGFRQLRSESRRVQAGIGGGAGTQQAVSKRTADDFSVSSLNFVESVCVSAIPISGGIVFIFNYLSQDALMLFVFLQRKPDRDFGVGAPAYILDAL